AVSEFTHPEMELLQRYIRYQVGGWEPTVAAADGTQLLLRSLGVASLIAGTTIASRLPRLAVGMKLRAVIYWLLGMALYILLIHSDTREAIGVAFTQMSQF